MNSNIQHQHDAETTCTATYRRIVRRCADCLTGGEEAYTVDVRAVRVELLHALARANIPHHHRVISALGNINRVAIDRCILIISTKVTQKF